MALYRFSHFSDLGGSDNLEDEIVQRVQTDNPPDVAFFPQPGLLNSVLTGTIDLNEWFSTTF